MCNVYTQIMRKGLYTVCPRSSDPFYMVTYYITWNALLLGHTVRYILQFVDRGVFTRGAMGLRFPSPS